MMVKEPWRIDIIVNKKNWLHKDYRHFDMIVPKIKFVPGTNETSKLMRKEAAKALEKMFFRARRQKINLYGLSGFRTYQRQREIFRKNYQKDGEKANMYSARPGQSEHQTGLAIDITCERVNFDLTENFSGTIEWRWLIKNAYLFGFILRYPKGKEKITGYNFEPWHFRYVGKELAMRICNMGICMEEM